LKVVIGEPLVRIPKKNAQLIDLEWTEEEQAHLKTLVERYICGVLQEHGGFIDGG